MSDAKDAFGFGKFVPGFDFLQGLNKGSASPVPGMPQIPGFAHWVAPTLDVEELDKRIEELKAVQFWLEQNGNALKATIQALEVQKMTLATLKGMNFHVGELAEAFKIKPGAASPFADVANNMVKDAMRAQRPEPAAPPSQPAAPAGDFASSFAPPDAPAPAPAEPPKAAAKKRRPTTGSASAKPAAAGAAGGVVDPMQWWGALTQQFQQIASQALADAAARTPPAPKATSAAKPAKAAAASASATPSAAPRAAKKKAPARKAATRRPSRK